MQTQVLFVGEARFDMAGQKLPSYIHSTAEKISSGLASRLHKYAEERMKDSGFQTENTQVTVLTLDGDDKPADRSYCVEFKNAKGGSITVVGIYTRWGWPSLDHGFEICGG